MNPTAQDKDTTLDEILRVVRDAGAWDDNMGGEDWSHSDRSIESAKQALLQWRDKAVVDELQRVICHKHGFGGDSCPAIKKRIAALKETPNED